MHNHSNCPASSLYNSINSVLTNGDTLPSLSLYLNNVMQELVFFLTFTAPAVQEYSSIYPSSVPGRGREGCYPSCKYKCPLKIPPHIVTCTCAFVDEPKHLPAKTTSEAKEPC